MKYAYYNGILLDGSKDMEPQRGKMILTDGEKIEKIVDEGTDSFGYEKIDLNGQYLMPGLINLHVHLPGSGKPKKKEQDNVKMVKLMTSNKLMKSVLFRMCAGFAKTQLMSGVTTIRTVGGIQNVDTQIRDEINKGKLCGPRILAANMAVSVPGGHMAGSLAYMATDEESARKFVHKIAKDSPDLIKLMITGGVLDAQVKGEPGVLRMKPELVKAAAEEAHKLGLPVAAHVESAEGVRVALENGVDSIEHGAWPDEKMLELFQQKQAFLVATISPALPFALFDRSVSRVSEMAAYNGKVVFEGIIECAKACLKLGVPVGLGTDTACPYITHYDMWRELYYYQKYCGVTNQFALYTATGLNAKLAGIDQETGTLQEGKCADFVVTKENPLQDLKALRQISMVVAKGKPIHHPKVKKFSQVERELDRYL